MLDEIVEGGGGVEVGGGVNEIVEIVLKLDSPCP